MQTVPAPPVERADRFGVYNWNVNDAPFPRDGSIDRLNWGADKVAELGSRTIRVALSTRDDYRVNPPGATDLVEIAKSAAYDKLFRDARFATYMLTVYSSGATAGNWADGFTATEAAAERDEMRRLSEYLLGNPALTGKTFILLNWEGDNAIFYHNNKQSTWDAYTAWIRARTEGVNLARQTLPANAVKVYSGLEFSSVRHPLTRQPCGTSATNPVTSDPLQNRCVIDYVAPQVEVDYYSYSSWDTANRKEGAPELSLKQIYREDLTFALNKVRARRPGVAEANFLIGELGFERTRYGECFAANHVNEMFDAFDGPDAFRVSYAVFWQVIDNNRLLGALDERFGLFRVRDGAVGGTLLSQCFQKRIAGETVPAHTGCARIRRPPEPPGVLNPEGTAEFNLHPDPVVSVYVPTCCASTEFPFTPAGNRVTINQFAGEFRLPADNPLHWYESATQINFSLPAARRPGLSWVYVTDGRGYDTNAQTIRLDCPSCPAINDGCGVLETNSQTLAIEAGSTVTISGARFSTSGNTVVLEQLDESQRLRRWRVPGGNVISESASQLMVKLPSDLLVGRDALIHVENAEGKASGEILISIFPACPGCGPRLKPCAGIVNEAGGAFTTGATATVWGKFAATGNKVIIEQFDRNGTLSRRVLTQGATGWSENETRIRFAIPSTLFPGRALIYVADAADRESRAQAIMIQPAPVAAVSAADFKGPSLAPESIATAFGMALATATEAATATPLPTALAGTQVLVRDSAGRERAAALFFVSPTQVNFQIPTETAPGTATITIANGDGVSSIGTTQIVPVRPAFFAANATGRGIVAGVALRIKGDGQQSYEAIALPDAATTQMLPVPIDLGPPEDQVFLILYGTGIRGRSALSAVSASIGGAPVEVAFADAHPTLVGLDQVNLRLPRSLAGRGEAAITLTADGLTAGFVTVTIK
ncbi:MAG: hypothetical protein SF339_22190 [Blastocatellia bacterium]|nr:hypothetical protein [Blastocatellia bacterium]